VSFLIKPLILLTVFLTPLLGAYQGFGYEQIKVLFFIFSISLIGFIWIFGKPKLEWNLIKLASFLFILTLFLSSGLGINFKSSFLGVEPYYQGLIVYAYLFVFSLIVSNLSINLKSYSVVLVGSGVVVALVALQDWFLKNIWGVEIPNYAGRVVSTFGQPNFYSGFLLLTLPFSYFLLKTQDKRMQFLGWGSGLISMLGILVSYSRSAIILALILLILALVDQLKIKKMAVVILLIVVLASILSINFSSGFIWKEFLKPLQTQNPDLTQESVESRVYIWPQAVRVGLEKPLFGYGLENISFSFSNYFEKNKHPIFEENLNISPVLISLKDLSLDRTHNYILDLFLFSGVFGVIAYLILIILLFKKVKQKTLLIGLITYLIWVQFQNQSLVHLLYFWFLVGVIDKDI